ALARAALIDATDSSFNQVSVDGDTSTNDMVTLLASGAAGGQPIVPGTAAAAACTDALREVCVELARMIARDGEGATRLIEVSVTGASSVADARRVARSVAGSSLLKAA